MRPPAPIHYLRPNHAEWSPAHVLFLDTESTTRITNSGELLSLRLWAASHCDRRPTRSGKQQQLAANGDTPETLVNFIEQCFTGRTSIWLFAHNLTFDLVTTRLPLALIEKGWRITDAAVGGAAPWMRLSKHSWHLTLVDSFSWLPIGMAEVGIAIGVPKPPLPDADDSRAAWLARCETDVTILQTAMLQILDWWDDNALGRFNITGAACGWNAFRHMPTPWRIVLDTSPDKIAADRLAVYGGRRGVWRVGNINAGNLLEIDIVGAYPTVAAELPLPMRRTSQFDALAITDYRLTSDRWGVVAEVEVETDTSRWPLRWRGATWFPTGRFRTTLAGPEITEAHRLNALREVREGQAHQLGNAMQDWGQWILKSQLPGASGRDGAVRILCKHWGRAVIGKWCSRGHERTELGPSPITGWGYEEVWDHDTGTKGGIVDIGGRRWLATASGQVDNAYPAVTAYVESHVRLRLSRVLEALGTGVVIQCDTDGLIATEAGFVDWTLRTVPESAQLPDVRAVQSAGIARLNQLIQPLELRIKRRYADATVLGPQHIETPDFRRFSGLPKHATRTGENKYAYHSWPKLQWQMGNGDASGYVRPLVTPTIAGPFAAGWVTTTGRVIPPRAAIDFTGVSQIIPWEFMPENVRRAALAPKQNPLLEGLY